MRLINHPENSGGEILFDGQDLLEVPANGRKCAP
jgi:hypothetical protein